MESPNRTACMSDRVKEEERSVLKLSDNQAMFSSN